MSFCVDERKRIVIYFVYGRKRRGPSTAGIVDMDEKTTTIKKRKGDRNMTNQNYLLASQVAEMMGEKWSRQRVHTELKRGKFPQPATYAGNQPLWTEEQIQRHIGKEVENDVIGPNDQNDFGKNQ